MGKKQSDEPIKKFESKYATMLIEHMEKGYTYESFQAVAQVNSATLKFWEEKKRMFKAAKQLAFAKSRMYWETIGILASQGNLTTIKKETVKKTTFFDGQGNVTTKNGKPEILEEIIERKREMIPLKGDVWKFVMQSQFGWQAADDPGKIDPEGKAQAIKKFQLAYAVGDQPYVIVNKGKNDETTTTENHNGSANPEIPRHNQDSPNHDGDGGDSHVSGGHNRGSETTQPETNNPPNDQGKA